MFLIIPFAPHHGLLSKKYKLFNRYPASHYAFDQPVETDSVIWNRERIEASLQGYHQEITVQRCLFGHTPVQAPLHVANQHYRAVMPVGRWSVPTRR